MMPPAIPPTVLGDRPVEDGAEEDVADDVGMRVFVEVELPVAAVELELLVEETCDVELGGGGKSIVKTLEEVESANDPGLPTPTPNLRGPTKSGTVQATDPLFGMKSKFERLK